MDLVQQTVLVGNFMDHHRRQGEIGRVSVSCDPARTVGLDAVATPGFRPPPQHIEHLLLKIDGDHSALVAHDLAIAIENIPMPQPTSMTVIPGCTYGPTIFVGLWIRRRSALSMKYPPHQGQTWAISSSLPE